MNTFPDAFTTNKDHSIKTTAARDGDGDEDGDGDVIDLSNDLPHQPNNKNQISIEEYEEEEELRQAIMASLQQQPHHTIDLSQQEESEIINPNPGKKNRSMFSCSVSETGQCSKSDFITCQICLQPKPQNQSFNMMSCSHSFCFDCMARYVEWNIQENVTWITCPQPNCQCALEPEFCRMFLPAQVFDKWCNALCDSLLTGCQKVHCPYKDCSGVLVVDDGEMLVDKSECPHCRRLFCAQCNIPWHVGISCQELQKLNEDISVHQFDEENKRQCDFNLDECQGSSSARCRERLKEVRLKLNPGSFYIPKEKNSVPEGEDAHFVCVEKQTIGLADGVGGWRKHGIDSGEYARQLMSNSELALKNESRGGVDPLRVLKQAYSITKAKGSCTACILTLKNRTLHSVNVGDSGFMVIRKGGIIYRSTIQQRRFNHPYQLGINKSSKLDSAKVIEVPVEDGDVIVAGTDGLFDNMFNEEIVEAVTQGIAKDRVEPQAIAWSIAQLAMYNSFDHQMSPFGIEAEKAKRKHHGGKVDDITVIVAHIYKGEN